MMVFIGRFLFLLNEIKNLFINRYLQENFRKRVKSIGEGVKFNGISYLTGYDNIKIGNNVHIGNNAFIRGEGGLSIGDNTHISRNLVLYSVNHDYNGKLLPYDSNLIEKSVTIEKNVWIGMNVTILPGSYIGEGAIVGAGSVVAGTIPPLAIYGASIGKQLKKRDEKHYEELEKMKKYGGVNGNALMLNENDE